MRVYSEGCMHAPFNLFNAYIIAFTKCIPNVGIIHNSFCPHTPGVHGIKTVCFVLFTTGKSHSTQSFA